MEVSFEKIKELMEKYCYYAEDELIWQTYINVEKFLNDGQVGQDIHAICLEGPPGSGKTEYSKIYKKVLDEILGENVDIISYQCDSTTGKAELYEEIRVSAAIAGNPDEVIIAGKLVEAIDRVNSGKKVILFLDEYDKAREETDAFLLQFLQEGKINTTQRGNVEIKPENLSNIHVILCKNQMRDELSGPLERRVKIIRLSEMKPVIFNEVAKRQIPNANPDILNAVAVLYGELYDRKDDFARIPSCSEGLMAIQDACTLLKAKAPREFICSAIISNMLKNPNDIETFKHMLSQDEQLAKFFKECCNQPEEGELSENEKLRRKMLEDFFSGDIKRVSQDIERVNRQIHDINIDHQYLESTVKQQMSQIEERDKTIKEQHKTIKEQQEYLEKLLASQKSGNTGFLDRVKNVFNLMQAPTVPETDSIPDFIKVGDDHKFVRTEGIIGEVQDNLYTSEGRRQMDKSVFDFSSDSDWNEIGSAILKRSNNKKDLGFDDSKLDSLSDEVLEHCDNSSLMCKDGYVVYNKGDFAIVAVRVIEEKETDDGKNAYEHKFKFFSNKLVFPIYALNSLMDFTHYGCYHGLGCKDKGIFIDCLVSGEEEEQQGSFANLDEISENLYHLQYKNTKDDLEDASQKLQSIFNFSNYFDDKYNKLRRSLERFAITRHRDMMVNGKIKSEYVLPIEKVKGFKEQENDDTER